MTQVLSAPRNGASLFESGPLHRSSSHSSITLNTSNPYLQYSQSSYRHSEYGTEPSSSAPSSAPSSPQLEHPSFSRPASYASTPASSLSLDIRTDSDEDDEEEILFPSFEVENKEKQIFRPVHIPSTYVEEDSPPQPQEPQRTHSSELPSDLPERVQDDNAVEEQPTRHVDYLSHEWREEDIWSSWRHIVARRNVYNNSARLENASWRTWGKVKYRLRTISPETLNWLKDCDVTWLYGPLQTESRKSLNTSASPPPSHLSTSSSFLDKKPILKKKSASQTILQRSISSHSLLKQASAMLQAKQDGPSKGKPSYQRSTSEFTTSSYSRGSVANTPTGDESYSSPSTRNSAISSGLESPSERRHIHFNNEVVQCIAVDSKHDEHEPEDPIPGGTLASDDSDDDGIVMMKPAPSQSRISTPTTPRGSFSGEGKTIKILPSTTLKYRGDTPEPNETQQSRLINRFWPTNKTLSPSPSQETLRPPRSQANFLLDDDDEDAELGWQPESPSPSPSSSSSSTLPISLASLPADQDSLVANTGSIGEDPNAAGHGYDPGPGMRRTPSGMFMPYDVDEDEDEAAMNNSVFGRVVDTVNTAKDIAHVIWNVGWRR